MGNNQMCKNFLSTKSPFLFIQILNLNKKGEQAFGTSEKAEEKGG